MSLVSNLFILFVAASVLIYYLVPRRFQWIVLLAFSYIYYIAGGPRCFYSFFHDCNLASGSSYRKNRRKWKPQRR